MAHDPKDIESWKAFIAQVDQKNSPTKKTVAVIKLSTSYTSINDVTPYSDIHWQHFTSQINDINRSRNNYISRQPPTDIKQKTEIPISQESQHFWMLKDHFDSPSSLDRFDKKQLSKIPSHQIAIIDLHGYTLSQAYEKLKSVFASVIHNKIRILKVITGKGTPDPDKNNFTLRQIFPQWMQEDYFKSKLIKFRTAPKDHGGEGAFLVYLKQKTNR